MIIMNSWKIEITEAIELSNQECVRTLSQKVNYKFFEY